jgi:hypothetical protein
MNSRQDVGFQKNISSPELSSCSSEPPTRGILKGGAYGSQEKGKEEKEKIS